MNPAFEASIPHALGFSSSSYISPSSGHHYFLLYNLHWRVLELAQHFFVQQHYVLQSNHRNGTDLVCLVWTLRGGMLGFPFGQAFLLQIHNVGR